MEFDRFTIVLLCLRRDAPELGDAEEDALQDAHLTYLARLHEEGHLLAAGPMSGPDDREVRGICFFRDAPEEAKRLEEMDPAVRAGKYSLRVYQWRVPSGNVGFPHGRLPRSMTEVQSKEG